MTPALAALKTWRPNLEITVVSEPLASPLLEDHPLIDELIVARQSVLSRASLITRLRKMRFDVAFNMHGGSTGAILARLSGARRSVGYRGLPMSRVLSDRSPSPDVILGRSRIHSVEQQLALLDWSGVPWPETRPRLSLVAPPQARNRLREKLQSHLKPFWNEALEGGFACIVPGAAFESKRWKSDGFAAVADHLKAQWKLPSIIIAGPGQEGLAAEVASATGARTPVFGGLRLMELAALLEMARVFVGNDSGPMHIAAALETPIVAVWGSSDPDVWRPWTEAPSRIVRGREGRVAIREIKLIASSEVIAAVDDVLELALEANHRAGVVRRAEGANIEL